MLAPIAGAKLRAAWARAAAPPGQGQGSLAARLPHGASKEPPNLDPDKATPEVREHAVAEAAVSSIASTAGIMSEHMLAAQG